ncbi:unnamed protein product [Darwinula stevensoni]|uniref:Ribosomal RNA small subunit methyltransferase G n=1 Tax=Darwinula stevensoni TaxID=69355 RepID=A0A7R8XAG3_9CRUS|nr:unnamed protein product [Darwinula stevensoni]CAG0885539.1 unnamed protein product [Darwinula stevensoni]
MEILRTHFPELTSEQLQQFEQAAALYTTWNDMINVISRTDIAHIELHHFLHSLAIAKAIPFKNGARILDLGTGGGFPGIPLAIFYPEVHFTLIDGTGKKIKVVQEVADGIGLKNVTAKHQRVEEHKAPNHYDFVVTRAVTDLDKLLLWSQPLISKKHQHAMPNGLIALKGGNLKGEIAQLPGKGKSYTDVFPITPMFKHHWFEEKFVVWVQG